MQAPPAQPDFASQLALFEAWLRSLDAPKLHPWRRVEVVEGQGTSDWHSGVSPEDFEQRWGEITSTVDRDWINLHAEGVRDETLIVTVEWFASDDPSHRRERQVSVNFSGPSFGGPAWDEGSPSRT